MSQRMLKKLPKSMRRHIPRSKALELARERVPQLSVPDGLRFAEAFLWGETAQHLMDHYGIANDKNCWSSLARCLARDFVPAATVSRSGRPRRSEGHAEGWVQALTEAQLRGANLTHAAEEYAKQAGARDYKKRARTVLRRWQKLLSYGGIATGISASRNANYLRPRQPAAKSRKPRKM